jgi:hypothetical protein
MAKTTSKKSVSKDVDLSDVIVVSDEPLDIDFSKATAGSVRLDDGALINVKNNILGELIFVDPVTKEEMRWPRCGEVLQIPLGTLRHMKTGAIKFFSNQLVVITGFADENAEKYAVEDIYKALYITQYYKDIIDPSNYNDICQWTPDEIRDKIPMLTAGAKGKLVVALNTYITKGILDSLRAIKTFEEVLGCDLKRPD